MDKAAISQLASHFATLSPDQRKNLFDSIRKVVPAPRRTRYMPPTLSPKQEAYLAAPNLEILFGGSAGGARPRACSPPRSSTPTSRTTTP